jgi:preprotein translocase subunit SecF
MSTYLFDINFLGFRKYATPISTVLLVLTLILFSFRGFNYGIDFTGGIVVEAQFRNPEKKAGEDEMRDLRMVMFDHGYAFATLQNIGDNAFMVRMQGKTQDSKEDVAKLKLALLSYDEDLDFLKVDFVGPKVSKTLFIDGMIALVFAMLAILAYVALRFDWKFSLAAIAALIHDVIVVLGFYLISGLDFDLTSVAAVLTVIGYSINDTVVIFDRIRENMRKNRKASLAEIINQSLNEMFFRTLLTSVTTLMACVSLGALGGLALMGFSLAIGLGIIFGTYSSICIATPIYYYICCKLPGQSGQSGQQQQQAQA